MARTYTAQSIDKNHDWDFEVDESGQITSLVIKAEVNFGEMGRLEEVDIWPLLNDEQKQAMQRTYDKVAQVFDNHILG